MCLLVSWCAGDGCNLAVDGGMIGDKRSAWCQTQGGRAESRVILAKHGKVKQSVEDGWRWRVDKVKRRGCRCK